MLLDAPDQWLNATRDSTNQKPSRRFKLQPKRIREAARAYADQIRVTTTCARCGRHTYAPLKQGREWFRTHACKEQR